MKITTKSLEETLSLGKKIGENLFGGEIINLIGDIGAGKTSLTKGIALGLKITEPVQSPTFTISRNYGARNNLNLAHYDFYRLNDAGIMKTELAETLSKPENIVIIEWGEPVEEIFPEDFLTVEIYSPNENEREFIFTANGEKSEKILEAIK